MTQTSITLGIIGLLFALLLFFRANASWGGKSSSLALLRVVIGFAFFVVMWDTANDYRIALVQSGHSPGASRGTKPAARGRRATISRSSNARTVVKEKYSLIETILYIVGLLYLLSRPDTWQFARRLTLAFRGIDTRPDDMPVGALPPEEPTMTEEDFEEVMSVSAKEVS